MATTKNIIKITLSLLLYLFSATKLFATNQQHLQFSANQQFIEPGFNYKTYKSEQLNPFAKLHVFEISLDKYKVAYCPSSKLTTATESGLASGALLAFNGAFFSEDNRPIGLRINNGKILSKFKPISWWGVLYVKNNKLHIKKRLKSTNNVSFAIQAGPRLVINGKIPKLKKAKANRTALGINSKGKLVVVVSEHAQITTQTLAWFFKDTLDCLWALNLDGGSSTQMYTNLKTLRQQVRGFNSIPDPICIYHRQTNISKNQ